MVEYDPLDYTNLAQSVVRAMLDRSPEPLPLTEPFPGSGVYAIYYGGAFEAYKPIRNLGEGPPIYVGKAIPSGGRRGRRRAGQNDSGRSLFKRLNEHAGSIEAVENLSLADFRCRYLVVKYVWITLAERFLIDSFRPVWNVVVDGFGNHPPGGGRTTMMIPKWDTIHPGRAWATRLREEHSAAAIFEEIRAHLQ